MDSDSSSSPSHKSISSESEPTQSETSETHIKKKVNTFQAVQGVDFFPYWNGDVYIGGYSYHHPKRIFRDGWGRYFAADGYTYTGKWIEDVFISGTISFPNKCIYDGTFANLKYNGSGMYKVENLGEFSGDFQDNYLDGSVSFQHEGGFLWKGDVFNKNLLVYPKSQFIAPTTITRKEPPEYESIQNPVYKTGNLKHSLLIKGNKITPKLNRNT